jgi:AraC family transcriptional activator of pobA
MVHPLSSRGENILNYNLFGESAHLPDVLHCETIAARSSLHNWELAPHRHDRLHQLLLLTAGNGNVEIDGQTRALAPMSLVNVPPGHVHAFSFKRGTEGWVTTLATELLDHILRGVGDVSAALGNAFVVTAGDDARFLMRRIAEEFDGRGNARALILRGLAGTLLGLAARSAPGRVGAALDLTESHLFQKFQALLEAHVLEHWRVNDYARAMAVSATHLSRVTRAATGRPASQLIDERIMREARRNLVYTNQPVAAITYALGYSDPAYFSRVFSRVTGLSPRAFRLSLARQQHDFLVSNGNS